MAAGMDYWEPYFKPKGNFVYGYWDGKGWDFYPKVVTSTGTGCVELKETTRRIPRKKNRNV